MLLYFVIVCYVYLLSQNQLSILFLQLNSGSTTYNATLNLTGHILLGLGIASSLLLYMFFNAFDSAGDSGGYSEESSGYGFFNRRSKVPCQQQLEIICNLCNRRIKYLVVFPWFFSL